MDTVVVQTARDTARPGAVALLSALGSYALCDLPRLLGAPTSPLVVALALFPVLYVVLSLVHRARYPRVAIEGEGLRLGSQIVGSATPVVAERSLARRWDVVCTHRLTPQGGHPVRVLVSTLGQNGTPRAEHTEAYAGLLARLNLLEPEEPGSERRWYAALSGAWVHSSREELLADVDARRRDPSGTHEVADLPPGPLATARHEVELDVTPWRLTSTWLAVIGAVPLLMAMPTHYGLLGISRGWSWVLGAVGLALVLGAVACGAAAREVRRRAASEVAQVRASSPDAP